jgi:hypothetical protein
MLFIFGISNGEKRLDFVQTMLCSHCGQFGRLEIYMTYMYFSIFFIPIFRWGRKYYATSTCCHTVYELEPELGKRILRGEPVELTERELQAVCYGGGQTSSLRCSGCGYLAAPDFEFCPKCGRRIK